MYTTPPQRCLAVAQAMPGFLPVRLTWLSFCGCSNGGGEYGGFCYLSAATVRTFTQQAGSTGRGLGWDKPSRDKNSSVPPEFSSETFGHLGFTGTAAWCDPKRQLIIVILTNRVHPTSSDTRFVRENIRRRLLETIQADLGLR